MEIDPLPKSCRHPSVTSRRQSSVSSSIIRDTDQIRPQRASSEVITSLISSLSSMPTIKSPSNYPVISLQIPQQTEFNTKSSSVGDSRVRNEGGFKTNSSSYKYSNIRRLARQQSYDKLSTSSMLASPTRSTCTPSEIYSPEYHPQELMKTNATCSTASRPSLSRDSNDFGSSMSRKFGICSEITSTEPRYKHSDAWSKKQGQLMQRTSKEDLRKKDMYRNRECVATSDRPINPERLTSQSLIVISENDIIKEKNPSCTKGKIKSKVLSIPNRESSLPQTSHSVRIPSERSRSHKDSGDMRSHSLKTRSVSLDPRERNGWRSERASKPSDFENLIHHHTDNSHMANIISSPSSPLVSSTLYVRQDSSLGIRNESGNTSSESSSFKQKNRLSGSLSPKALRNSRIISSEKPNLDERPSSSQSIDEAVEAYLSSSKLSQKIRHPQTGRLISFSEVGDSDGFAVFCCVGMGLTRFITAFYDELATTLKLRLITPDRPGVGDSEPYADGTSTPLSWPDDVYAICQFLRITKFSILAHSAGAIYALATALRMPQHIRGRVHLLAPWIPPSQMNVIGVQVGLPPTNFIPTSQRILRVLPTPILKAANSSFMSATTSSLTGGLSKSRRTKHKPVGRDYFGTGGGAGRNLTIPGVEKEYLGGDPLLYLDPSEAENHVDHAHLKTEAEILAAAANSLAVKERQVTYESKLTHALWNLATQGANPAVDLLVCLERRHTIGFRYVDITRSVVIHHGSKDTRVPLENVQWMGKTMKRCDVRVLDGEGHGLMASASIMSSILTEISKEWEDWMKVTSSMNGFRNEGVRKSLRERASAGGLR